jgi:hypothetical protein
MTTIYRTVESLIVVEGAGGIHRILMTLGCNHQTDVILHTALNNYTCGMDGCPCQERENTVTPEEIKEYCEHMLARSECQLEVERTASYYEDQIRLRELWLRAEQAQILAVLAEQNELAVTLLKRIAIAVEALNPGR